MELTGPVTYSTSNPAVARVAETGLVTAVSGGTAEIRASLAIRGVTQLAGMKATVREVPFDEAAAAAVVTADIRLGWQPAVVHIRAGGTVTWFAGPVPGPESLRKRSGSSTTTIENLESLPLRDGRATTKFETRGTFRYCSAGCWDPPDLGVVQVH